MIDDRNFRCFPATMTMKIGIRIDEG